MFDIGRVDKKLIAVLGIILFLCAGMVFERLYQPYDKTLKIYSQALDSYNNGDYQNSYFLFSKVGHFSKLKPAALYRQALCANKLGDSASEILAYKTLIDSFPASKLVNDARYRAGQLLIDSKPKLAQKYFKSILHSNIKEDYKIASGYFISKINTKNPKAEKTEVEAGFREYLTKYPNGRLALNVARDWRGYNSDLKPSDVTLVARAYNYAGLNTESSKILSNAKFADSWALQGINAFLNGNIPEAKNITLTGISKYSDNVPKTDYVKVIDLYMKNESKSVLPTLADSANGKYKDYLLQLKCKHSSGTDKYACYENLYAKYPNGEYAPVSMINSMIGRIVNRNYNGARIIANDFISKYPDSEYVPMAMFWSARINQRFHSFGDSTSTFNVIIEKYPDSYYAYRSFWILNDLKSLTLNADIENKPVKYPYKNNNIGTAIYNLVKLKDYEMVEKYTDDEFIKSWCEYQKGNYVSSMHTAKKAMEKLSVKPEKTDLRWRLVYPIKYYDEISKYSNQYGNDMALIMAIVKEESHFNKDAVSGVGAAGLMQLMPQTAAEIASRNNIALDFSELFVPDVNIRFGSLYYSNLRSALKNNDIYAVAAYNGGIGSVTRWSDNLRADSVDEFVEQIPYEETRNYVFKVMKSYWNYTRIYQK